MKCHTTATCNNSKNTMSCIIIQECMSHPYYLITKMNLYETGGGGEKRERIELVISAHLCVSRNITNFCNLTCCTMYLSMSHEYISRKSVQLH